MSENTSRLHDMPEEKTSAHDIPKEDMERVRVFVALRKDCFSTDDARKYAGLSGRKHQKYKEIIDEMLKAPQQKEPSPKDVTLENPKNINQHLFSKTFHIVVPC